MPPTLRRLLPLGLLAVVLYGLSRSWGAVPALGPFLDPSNGVWGVAWSAAPHPEGRALVPGLSDSVVVIYDDRAVPHVFAATALDAQRALGYVVARDRLFQLELQARATAGRLTEWAGSAALGLDRTSRGLGLARAAQEEFEFLQANAPETAASLEAFAEGVNAWIERLPRRRWPLEYHLLQAAPEPWRAVYSVYLVKRMSRTLSYASHDRLFDALADLVGPEAARALIPARNNIQEPIVPNGGGGPRFDALELPPPGPRLAGRDPGDRAPMASPIVPGPDEEPIAASNNWAVAPSKSATGVALLSGDPHLGLSLPAVWYEAHLRAGDGLDSYGAALIGVPAIVIGFNRDVAWSFTNNAADVIDYYRETVDAADAPTRTRLDDGWAPVEALVEVYRDRRGDVIEVDTLYRSHRGPMFRDDESWYSMRWLALEPRATLTAMAGMNRATSVADWLRATENFHVPSQNGVVAGRDGHIAIRSLGQVPRRPTPYQFMWDGTTSSSDWSGHYPTERLPFAIDPPQGFLASANQQPADPERDSTYWGRRWPTPWRAMRINEVLRADSSVTVEDMRRLQTDPLSVRARHILPYFVRAAGPEDDQAAAAADILATWDGRYTPDAEAAILFELALEETQRRLWDELQGPDGVWVYRPAEAILAGLLDRPADPWWDIGATPTREQRDDILRAALARGLESTEESYGPRAEGNWAWSRVRAFSIAHLLRLPGLGAPHVPNIGGPSTLSPMALRGSHGASWRMVVEMGDTVRAWTTYPGGQSGNPASPWYDDRIGTWSAGELSPARFPSVPGDLTPEVRSARLVLHGAPER